MCNEKERPNDRECWERRGTDGGEGGGRRGEGGMGVSRCEYSVGRTEWRERRRERGERGVNPKEEPKLCNKSMLSPLPSLQFFHVWHVLKAFVFKSRITGRWELVSRLGPAVRL